MNTPWGDLRSLNLFDRELAERILMADKHQLVEGMVVECLYDQILENLPEYVPDVTALDVETVIAQPKDRGQKKIAVVWAREKKSGLGRYLIALEKCFIVYLVEYEIGHGFFGSLIKKGKRCSPIQPISELMKPIAAVPYQPFKVSETVRDTNRQREAIYGFLFSHHRDRLVPDVLLPRILINCAVQPWFNFVWNIDKIFIIDGMPWLFEVKHKFPYRDKHTGALQFGLNDGEVSIFRLLINCGIGCFFSIMVKPKWSKNVGSLYMITELIARKKTALLGIVLDAAKIKAIYERASGVSGSNTTITGYSGGQLRYKGIPATDFGMLGRLSDDPADVAERIVAAIRGKDPERATDQMLEILRMSC